MSIKKVRSGREAILKQQRMEDEFVSRLLAIAGDVRMFAMAQPGDTTTTTEKSKNADVITWSESLASFDAPVTKLGEGYAWEFNGTDEEGDTPDSDIHSFGDGANDSPFSVMALVNSDVVANKMIACKIDLTPTVKAEWGFEISASGKPQFFMYGQAASGTYIGRVGSTALTASTWELVSGTYDGAHLPSGITVYQDGVATDDADLANGTYLGMSNTATTMKLAHQLSSGVATPWNGKIAFVLLTGKELNADEQWAIKELVNWFYGLSL